MKLYRLRFKPTGHFYKPATGYTWQKQNLSPNGKTYTKKSINFETVKRILVPSDILPHRTPVYKSPYSEKYPKAIETYREDWEWVEYDVIESKTYDIQ